MVLRGSLTQEAHPFDHEFALPNEARKHFRRDGFVKLKSFFNEAAVDFMRSRFYLETDLGMPSYYSDTRKSVSFSRSKYDFETEKQEVYEEGFSPNG